MLACSSMRRISIPFLESLVLCRISTKNAWFRWGGLLEIFLGIVSCVYMHNIYIYAPMRPDYVCTVHKGQGLTMQVVYAVLEGLFADTQVYVQTSRTPEELNFLCVGLPPQDLFIEFLEHVRQMHNVAQDPHSTWESLRQGGEMNSVEDVHDFEATVWEKLDSNDRGWAGLEEALG